MKRKLIFLVIRVIREMLGIKIKAILTLFQNFIFQYILFQKERSLITVFDENMKQYELINTWLVVLMSPGLLCSPHNRPMNLRDEVLRQGK